METPTENGFNLSGNDQKYQKNVFPLSKDFDSNGSSILKFDIYS